MRLRNAFLTSMALVGLFLASCEDKKDGPDFSNLSVEENKAMIEENGLAMLDLVQELEGVQTVDVAVNMIDYMDRNDLFENNPNFEEKSQKSKLNEFFKPIIITANLKNFNPKKVASEMSVKFEDEYTLVDIWDEIKGTYTWNNSTESWDYTTGNEVQIRFPSTETGTTNNVTFRIYDFLYEEGPFSWTEDYTGELPKQIKSELKIDNTVLLAYSLNITYENTEDKPNSVSTTLEIPPFTWSFGAENDNNTSASVEFTWTKNTDILVKFTLGADGNWTEENLNPEPELIGEVIKDGNASFQVMNIKIAGDVNVKTLESEINKLDEEQFEDDEAFFTEMCKIINKYANLYVCYADNNKVIALVIAYPQEYTYYYWSYEYSTSTGLWEWVEVEETRFDVGLKFQFKDDSTVDMETYFEEGFDSLVQELEDYFEYLDSEYGSEDI